MAPRLSTQYLPLANGWQVLKIVAMSSFRRRGQAWVVFEDTSAAKTALESMQGFPFCGKPMVIATSPISLLLLTQNSASTMQRARATQSQSAMAPLCLERRSHLGQGRLQLVTSLSDFRKHHLTCITGTKPNTVAKAPPPSSSAAPADMSTSGEQPAKRSKIVVSLHVCPLLSYSHSVCVLA